MGTVSFIASDGDNVLWDRLSAHLEEASVLRIASAFLGAGDEITSWVNQRDRCVEIIVRLEFPTNPESVANLLKHPRVAVRASGSKTAPFHEKLFLAIDSKGARIGAYVGSANWTQGGLRKNREAGLWVADHEVLQQIETHFTSEFQDAREITEQMLAGLRLDRDWEVSHGKRPRKEIGTLIASWPELGAASDGRYLVKQGGLSVEAFVEGEHDFRAFMNKYNYSSQTVSNIPSTFKPGLGAIVSRIARRRNGLPDRLVYGRGRIAGFDRKRWRLPERYLVALRQRGLESDKIEFLRRWPYIFWLDPAEFINYPPRFGDFLWLGDYMNPSFQKGFRWVSAEVWTACNRVLDEHTQEFGVLSPDRQDIWWNYRVGITDPNDPLFMTKARIEEMNDPEVKTN